MKKTIIIGLSLTLALALIATAALAWGPGFGPGPGRGPGFGCSSLLNLTAEQAAQIETLREAHRQGIEPLRQELATKGTELRGLRFAPNQDAAATKAKQEEFFALRSKLWEEANKLRTDVQKVLTPEQLAQAPTCGPGRGLGPDGGGGRGPRGRW